MILRQMERHDDRVRVNFKGYNTLFPLPPDERISISSMEEFQLIGTEYPSDGNFVLTKDLDAAGFEYEPVSLSNARFDGQDHTISNLALSRTTYVGDNFYLGLFKDVNYSLVKNLTLANADMTCLIVGAFAATATGSRFINNHVRGANILGGFYGSAFLGIGALNNVIKCTVDDIYVLANAASGMGVLTETSNVIDAHVYSGTIIGVGGFAGLFAQMDKGGLVESCSTKCILRFMDGGDEGDFLAAGGLVAGSLSDTTFRNCATDCTFENIPAGIVGSLIGSINSGTHVEDCLGIAHGAQISLFGYDDGDTTVINAYWDIITSDQTSGVAGTGKTTLELQDCTTFSSWDTETIWSCSDGAYPTLNEWTGYIEYLDPSDIEIGTIEDFQKIGVEETHPVFRNYILTSDLDLTGVTWIPIDLYNGNFNGNGHSLSNLLIDAPDANEVGLFRRTNEVRGLTLINASVTGESSVGCILGTSGSASGRVYDCTGLNCEVFGQSYTGLLAGSADYVDYCRGEGTVHAYGSYQTYYGGLSGACQSTGYSSFVGTLDTSTASFVGGLTGVGQTITSHAECDVVGVMNIGGLIGHGCKAYDSYHIGGVNGHTNVGGLIGGNHQYCTPKIYRSYQDGDVIGVAAVGPVIGYVTPFSGFFSKVENFYYNEDYSVPTLTGKYAGTPLSTAEMTCPSSSFEGFDFASIWECVPGSTPTHQAEIMTAPIDEPSDYLLYPVNDGQQFRDFKLPHGNDWWFENVYIAFAEELVNAEEAWLALYVNGGKIIKIQDLSAQENFVQNEIAMQAGDRIVPVVTGENGSEYVGPYYEGYITFRKI